MTGDQRTAQLDGDWRVLLPPGWLSLPTDEAAAAKAISRLLDAAFKGQPRDELVQMRIEIDRSMRRQVRNAARAGAKYVHALVRPIEGMPVSATLITSQAAADDPNEIAATLSTILGEGQGVVENGYVDLSDERGALRRMRRWKEPLETGDESTEQMLTAVDYVVPLDDGTVLIMAFSTSTEPVHEELVVVFDAIATTLHRSTPAKTESSV